MIPLLTFQYSLPFLPSFGFLLKKCGFPVFNTAWWNYKQGKSHRPRRAHEALAPRTLTPRTLTPRTLTLAQNLLKEIRTGWDRCVLAAPAPACSSRNTASDATAPTAPEWPRSGAFADVLTFPKLSKRSMYSEILIPGGNHSQPLLLPRKESSPNTQTIHRERGR